MKKLILNQATSKRSTNVDNHLTVEAFTERKLLPTDDVTETVDSYQEYVKEKDASDKYRLAFTINPVCSNILFNPKTEIVYKEGSDEAEIKNSGSISYAGYKGNANAIDDTAFSHPDIGNYEYHCGLDIFNNHTLRAKDFTVVNKEKTGLSKDFNTIRDYLRDSSGEKISDKIAIPFDGGGRLFNAEISTDTRDLHLYTRDNILSFQQTVNDKLVESDGWVGFINPVTLNIPNIVIDGKEISLNKCINNRGAGEFIDMYPGRDLYSFIPKVNPYRKRLEKNWDYCLTYPYMTSYDERFVMTPHGVNGIRCTVTTNLTGTIFDNNFENGDELGIVYLRTQFSNTLQQGDSVSFTITHNGITAETSYPITVEDVGYEGEDTKHFFAVKLGELYSVFSELASYAEGGEIEDSGYTEDFLDSNGYIKSEYDIRMRKRVNGMDCKYYVRLFRRIPNFNGKDINLEDGVSETELSNVGTEFGSSINKIAFSENIFSDKMAQILYDEDVILTGLRDNMGRPLSEIFLTIVKRNAGHDIWETNPGSSDVEYSHCFGAVTSGFDMAPEENDFNVHKICKTGNTYSVSVVENDIAISGNSEIFVGDLVEFSPYTVSETVLEDIYHRFNTVQRENNSKTAIVYTSIDSDVYDLENFVPSSGTEEHKSPHEGYYYKPHYRIPIRQYDTAVKQGQHKRLVFIPGTVIEQNGSFSGTTAVNQYLCRGDKLYIYNKETGARSEGMIESVSGKNFTNITFSCAELANKQITRVDENGNLVLLYNIFKVNPEMEDYSYDLMDATGRYLWREELSDSALTIGDELYDSVFTNGAHYRHTRINFYLRRQDPTGEYGLNIKDTWDEFSGASSGSVKEFSDVEYIEEGLGNIC